MASNSNKQHIPGNPAAIRVSGAFHSGEHRLSEEYSTQSSLIQKWKKEYGQYKPLDKELSRLLAVRHCAEIVMKGDQKRTHVEVLQIQP